jgi:tetratricopeptide (TPR) repeat protein
VRRLLEMHPGDAWALRELALILVDKGRFADGWEAAHQAALVEPRAAQSHGVLAVALKAAGRIEEAREHCRRALRLDADYAPALTQLVGLAQGPEPKRAELDFIRAEMLRQNLDGAALRTYLDLAAPLLEPERLLAQLRELRANRPDLPAAWSVLVRHLLATGAVEEACAVATEALGRFSRQASAWLDAARAHRAVPRWDKAIQCAGSAAELAPRWPEPWVAWAAFLEDAGRLDQALAALRRAARRLPQVPAFPIREAAILWRLGRRDAAFEAILAAVQRFPGEAAAWTSARRWAAVLGQAARVQGAARRVTRERPGEAGSWLILAQVLDRSAMDGKLAACDRALALNPRLLEARDLKAELLASQGRFGEAMETCSPGLVSDRDAPFLEGRIAWLLWQQDRRPEALARMDRLLEQHPDYTWGWQQLLEWAGTARSPELERRAAAALDRLAPHSFGAVCRAADAAVRADRWPEAGPLYRRAMELAPGSSYPLHQWLRYCWGRRDAAAIRETAAGVPPGPARAVAEAYLLLADAFEDRRGPIPARLAGLVRSREPMGPVLAELRAGLGELGWSRLWTRELDQAAAADEIGMAFASSWVDLELERGRSSAWRKFAGWIQRAHEDAAGPIGAYFDRLARDRRARVPDGFFRSPAAAWAQARTPLLGKVGYALAAHGQWARAARWLEDAERRQDAEGWIAANLVLALDRLGRSAKATAVAGRVVERGLKDGAWPNLVAQLAFGSALAGDPERAKAALAKADPPRNGSLWQWKHLLASSLVRVLEAGPAQARSAQAAAIRDLRQAARRGFRTVHPGMLRDHRQALARMARHSGAPVWPWNLSARLVLGRIRGLAARLVVRR